MRFGQVGRPRQMILVEDSPLRAFDPRTKLFFSLGISLVLMMPLTRLLIFLGIYSLFLLGVKLFIPAAKQVWRIKFILLILFLADWWLVDLTHALTICLRLILLSGVFILFFATTTTRELGLALEKLGLPYRYAFSMSLAFQSLGLLDDEWRAIKEAQQSRGAFQEISKPRQLLAGIGGLISLTVPAIVLTTKRAWTITEAAYARGFESPQRRSYYSLSFHWWDWVLLTGLSVVVGLMFWL